MSDTDSQKGPNLTYYLLLNASEFPGESSYSIQGALTWGRKLKAVHQNLSYSHKTDEEYLAEFDIIKKKLDQISKDYYPAERYVSEAYDTLYEWLGSLSRLYYRLGMMTNENPGSAGWGGSREKDVTTVTETGDNQDGR